MSSSRPNKPRTAPAPASRSERRREEILNAATLALNRDGVKGMTLASVAASLGMQTPNITYYFRKKEDLAIACLTRGVERLAGVIRQAAEAPDLAGRLEAFVTLYFQMLRRVALDEEPPLALLDDLFALEGPKAEPPQQELTGALRTFRGFFKTSQMAHLDWRARTARAHLAFNMVSWTPAWIVWYDPEDYGRAAERLLDLMLRGLAPPDRTPELPAAAAPTEAADEHPTRHAFMVAATRLINRQGYRGARIDELAAQLSLTRGSFYHHVDAKEDLVVACFRRSFEIMRRAQRAALDQPGDGGGRLSRACASLIAFQLSPDGPLLRSTALSALSAEDRMNMVMASLQVSMRFAAMISDGIADGSVRPVDADIASQAVTAGLNATPDLALPDLTAAEVNAIYLRPLLAGLLAP